MKPGDYLVCTCCGDFVKHTKTDNVAFGQSPYPYDEGYGMCRECGGEDLKPGEIVKDLTDSQIKKKMGWAKVMFFEARFPIIESKLTPENLEKWKMSSFAKKAVFITSLIEKGEMI